MEYGIHFNNDDTNKNILAALEEVNNTFFVENLSPDSEENTSDYENVDDINNLNKNFNEMHLNNFKFVENPDNFIENEVYNKLKLEVEEFFQNGKYSCDFDCYDEIGYEQFLARRMEFESLNKNMCNMVIKG